MTQYQLYSVRKSDNRVIRAIGDPDTHQRVCNFKKAHDGTYQPAAYFVVWEAGKLTPDRRLPE